MATFAERRSKTTAGSRSETPLSRRAGSLPLVRPVRFGLAARAGKEGRTLMASAGGGISSGREFCQRTTATVRRRWPVVVRWVCIPRRSQPRRRRRRRRPQSKRRRDDLAGAILGPLPAGASSGEVRWNWARGYHQIVRPRPPIACDLFLRALPPALTVACRRLVAVSGRSTSIETPTRFTAGWTR